VITFEVDTDAGPHHVSWRGGSLVLHDHDLVAERVLGALGGEPCMCLLVLEALREAGSNWHPEGVGRLMARGLTRMRGGISSPPPVTRRLPDSDNIDIPTFLRRRG